MKWYEDESLVRDLPRRYRAYALYSRLAGDRNTRRVRGGSFLLRALRRISSAGGLDTKARVHGIDGLVVLADFADERVLDVIHEIRGENPEYRVMRALLNEGDTFVDVGANFGTFSLLASRMTGLNGKVIAIEPQEHLARSIAESAQLSGCGNCEIRNVACGSHGGDAELLVPVNDSGRAGLFAGFSGRAAHQAVTVPVATLDSILTETHCPGRMLLKIDVEGSEVDVLEGAREVIAARRPAIMVEINPWSAGASGRSPEAVIDFLESAGYTSFAQVSSFPMATGRSGIPTGRQSNIVALT